MSRFRTYRRRARVAWRVFRTGGLATKPHGHFGTGASPHIDLFGCECQRCGLHSRHWKQRPDCEPTIVRVIV